LSAATGEGAEALAAEVARRCGGLPVRVKLTANCTNGRLMNFIARHARVQQQRFSDSTAHIEAIMPSRQVQELRLFGPDVRVEPIGTAAEGD
jgi:50S ribosomal subunit-associated GTPase HflX